MAHNKRPKLHKELTYLDIPSFEYYRALGRYMPKDFPRTVSQAACRQNSGGIRLRSLPA
jgi:hypothetical protein